jgi:hypothetical protein
MNRLASYPFALARTVLLPQPITKSRNREITKSRNREIAKFVRTQSQVLEPPLCIFLEWKPYASPFGPATI